jgi:hypothetical protein
MFGSIPQEIIEVLLSPPDTPPMVETEDEVCPRCGLMHGQRHKFIPSASDSQKCACDQCLLEHQAVVELKDLAKAGHEAQFKEIMATYGWSPDEQQRAYNGTRKLLKLPITTPDPPMPDPTVITEEDAARVQAQLDEDSAREEVERILGIRLPASAQVFVIDPREMERNLSVIDPYEQLNQRLNDRMRARRRQYDREAPRDR